MKKNRPEIKPKDVSLFVPNGMDSEALREWKSKYSSKEIANYMRKNNLREYEVEKVILKLNK